MAKMLVCIRLRNMRKNGLSLLLVLLPLTATAQDARVYRWVDSNNVVHFSFEHPSDKDYAEVDVKVSYKPVPKSNDSNTASSPAPLNTNNEIETQTEQLSSEIEMNKELMAKNCEAAKVNIKVLGGYEKVLLKQEDGTERLLTPEEKQAQLELSQQQLKDFCQ